jgi:hypothetical protein
VPSRRRIGRLTGPSLEAYASIWRKPFFIRRDGLLNRTKAGPSSLVPTTLASPSGSEFLIGLPVMAELQSTPLSSSGTSLKEKAAHVGNTVDEKDFALDPDKSSDGFNDEDEGPLFVNGEPVITSGRDVSKFLVDLRDDEDPPFTFRSVVLGTLIGGLGAALYQVCTLALNFVGAVTQPRV